MTRRSLGYRAPLLWVLLPLMAGLVAGKLQWLPLSPVWWAAAGVVFIGVALGWRRAWISGLLLGVFLSGAALYELRRDRLPDWDALPPREVRAMLEIDRVFPPKPGMNTVGGLGRLVSTETHLAELAGQSVYFSISMKGDAAAPIPTARLRVIGVLQTLERNPAGGTFEDYLAAQGVNFKLTRTRILEEVKPAGAYARFCDATLRRFNAILGRGISAHPQETAVLRAMLTGQQQELDAGQKDVFRESGTMHLFSISGLHVAVIAGVIIGVLQVMRLPAVLRVVAGGVLLWLYVDVTGGAPSAVRAFLMVMFLHASHVLRLPGNPFSALVASAVCVLVVQPMQAFTASFQLSYGIVAALLLLGLPLADHWMERGALFEQLPKVSWRWYHHTTDWLWRQLLGALAIGLATTVVGAISGVVIFKLLTPVALAANLALIPLGSLVIVSGFLALLAGLVGLGGLAVLLNHASVVLLLVIEKGVRFFVGLPGAYRAAEFTPEWFGYAAFAGLLGVILFGYANSWERKRGGFWVPFAYTLLVLIAGMRFIVPPA